MVCTALVADPDPQFVGVVRSALEARGIATFGSTDGISAIKTVAEKKPSLVIAALDLGGLSGFDLFAKIRKSPSGGFLPLFALSNPLSPDEQKQLGTLFRLSALFLRPVNIDQLVERAAALTKGEQAPSPVQKERVFAGRLAERPFHEILLFLFKRRLSGRLTLKGPETIVVDFAAGKPYHLEGVHLGLAEYLRKKGTIDDEEYAFFMTKAREVGEEALEWLVRMGALSVDALRLERDRYRMGRLGEVFSWDGGSYHFRGADSKYNPSMVSAINFPELIHRGLLETVGARTLADFFRQHGTHYVTCGKGFYDFLYFLKLDPYEVELLERFDGRHSFESIVAEGKGKWEPDQAVATVYILRILGMLAFEPDSARPATPPEFPMRKRPPMEDVDYVKVSLDELDSLIADQRGEEEETEDLWETEDAGFISIMPDELGDVAEEGTETFGDGPGLHAPAGMAAGTAPPVDPEQEALEQELVEYHGTLKSKNYYELFGLTRERFDFSKMKESYHQLVKKFSPERFMMSAGEMMAASEEVLSEIATAYNVLSNVVSKEQYDEQIRKAPTVPTGGRGSAEMHVEVQYNSGLAFLETADYSAAESAFREVLDVRSDHFPAIAHFAWAMYAQEGRRGNKTFADQAMRHLRTVQNEMPDMPEVFAYRGMILLDQGKQVLAEVEFKKALSRKPKMRLALEGLAEIDRQKTGEKKRGFFSRR